MTDVVGVGIAWNCVCVCVWRGDARVRNVRTTEAFKLKLTKH